MKHYTILGSHPGDGCIIYAKNMQEALIKFMISDGLTKKVAIAQLKITPVKKQESTGRYIWGDYEIIISDSK